MNTRSLILMSLMLTAGVLTACKSKTAENKEMPASPVATGSADPAPMAKPAGAGSAEPTPTPTPTPTPSASGAVDPLSVPAVPVPPGKEKHKGPGATITASFEDPATSPHKSITGCPGDKVAIVVPARASTWTVVKAPDGLGKPTEDVVKGWLGPGTDGAKFTWVMKEAGEHTLILEEQQTHEKVALEVALFGCD